MLKHFALALLLAAGAASPTFAQTITSATSQPKQFCRLTVTLKTNGTIANVIIAYGQESKQAPVTDSQLAADVDRVKGFDSEALVLNYLSSRGWEIVGYNSLNAYYSTYLLQRPAK